MEQTNQGQNFITAPDDNAEVAMTHPLFEKHRALLEEAQAAITRRTHWTPYPENPRAYGETALDEGARAFEAYHNAQFYLDQPDVLGRCSGEVSPYGLPLNVSYPRCSPEGLIAAAKSVMLPWVRAGIEARTGVCLEILARLNASSAEMAYALMHTTGQSLARAFLTGGPQAQSRGLEALAWAYREMARIPGQAEWQRSPSQHLEKRFMVAPLGISLVIGSATQPTWNAYPALFASLATGNPVIVKPHPTAILPLALTVAVARQVLKEAGFAADLVSLLVGDPDDTPVVRDVSLHSSIRLIDYAGAPDLGNWLIENARQARLFVETGGVNCVLIDSTSDYKALLKNLVFSLCLDAGQLRSSPRLIFVSREGVQTPDDLIGPEQFRRELAFALGKFIEDPARAVEILGAIQSPATVARIRAAGDLAETVAEVLRPSEPVSHPQWTAARIFTPLLVAATADQQHLYMEERFGPIAMVVTTANSAESLALAETTMRDKGALNFLVHATRPHVKQLAEEVALRVGVTLSFNLTGAVLINQSAGFADFHASGANPAATCGMIDAAFVANRFYFAQVQQHYQSPTSID
ncbi:MAG: phenylacetic acid degradation protein PaaN [Hydrogenophaga sp.]|uniref:phenylacetic acid degradation protein PaaN n=1 Tax=Hydrogenophaga sp. TaxID=1904254 RepID=UPI0027794189|nr:phenylacetic acid degradation protein PaaN [Hydrogenophaga sp.]MDP1526670.1 phenylacetic acid degradation protein PaaN [Rhodocyclaceae bacterium]MDZ4190186.1 phenylacetic acid degradation protein PaaN [Hydrogenophaga sp.]